VILLAAVIRAGLGCGYITSPVADRSRNGWGDAACAGVNGRSMAALAPMKCTKFPIACLAAASSLASVWQEQT